MTSNACLTDDTRLESIFRFRPLESINKHDELNTRSIYFAEPGSLNDPNEGIVNFLWRGDDVIWKNFAKNYVYSLVLCWSEFLKAKEQANRFEHKVNVQSYKLHWVGPIKELRDMTWKDLRKDPSTNSLIEYLVNIGDSLCLEELVYHFKCFHLLSMSRVLANGEQLGIIKPTNNEHILNRSLIAAARNLKQDSLNRFKKNILEFKKINDISTTDAVLGVIPSDHIHFMPIGSKDELFVTNWFTRHFFDSLDRFIFSDWYLACFSRSHQNSSMWGQYASSHTGYCLEFNLNLDKSLGLQSTKGTNDLRMFNMMYDGIKDVDFFSSLPLLENELEYNFWLKGEDGNISKNASNYSDKENWLRNYDAVSHYRFLSKSADWKHENECRVVISDHDKVFHDKADRVMVYASNSLASITFGMKMPEDIKDGIKKKYTSEVALSEVAPVELYQAYYSPEEQKMKRYKIPD